MQAYAKPRTTLEAVIAHGTFRYARTAHDTVVRTSPPRSRAHQILRMRWNSGVVGLAMTARFAGAELFEDLLLLLFLAGTLLELRFGFAAAADLRV